ncbi:MAG: NUDIX domain-containing protein [Alphaproteobacteria bacterium]|nr:NUDIX domain-containing protein [Alphaproteobacteria bacterium]MBT5389099.1 NUDIX domain-containing protein [Alphaproteobacteria bacterium]MBT5654485.1 NUDIX domain-containing protein [Alphaproteobacteria bacterium]
MKYFWTIVSFILIFSRGVFASEGENSYNFSEDDRLHYSNKLNDVIQVQAAVRGFLARKQIKEGNAAHKIQSLWRAWRAYHPYEMKWDINIWRDSERNFRRGLKSFLGRKDKRETEAVSLFIKYFTSKHASKELVDMLRSDSTMLSTRERMRKKHMNQITHTGTSGNAEDFLFFVGGLGRDHNTPGFLKDSPYTILMASGTDTVEEKYAFASGHLVPYSTSASSQPVRFGESLFWMTHDKASMSKRYHYKTGDTENVIDVPFGDEVLHGAHMVPGLAYQFLEILAQLDHQYRDDLLDFLSSKASEESKLARLSAIVSYLMPGEYYPEVKVPCRVNILHDGIDINLTSYAQSSLSQVDVMKRMHALMEVVRIFKTEDLRAFQGLYDKNPWIFAEDSYGRKFAENVFRGKVEALSVERVQSIIEFASQENWPDSVKLVLHNHAITYAAEKGLTDLLSWLLNFEMQSSADESIRLPQHMDYSSPFLFRGELLGGSGVFSATKAKHMECVQVFFDHGLNLSYAPQILQIASWNNDVEAFETALTLMQNSGHSLEGLRDHEILMQFAAHGNVTGMKLAVQAGVPVGFVIPAQAQDNQMWTALHAAAAKGHMDAVKWLVEQEGIDLDARTLHGETALFLAHKKGHVAVRDYLESCEASTNMVLSERELCEEHRFNVAGIVTGGGKVLLGRNWILGKKSDFYQFPGGIVDATDVDEIAAAVREVEEETGLPISKLLSSGKVKSEVVYTYRGLRDNTAVTTTFVHFDLGDELENSPIWASDDLAEAIRVSVDGIESLEKPVRRSNSLLLKMVANSHSEGVEDPISEALMYENFGTFMMDEAAESGEVSRMRELVDAGVPATQLHLEKAAATGSLPLMELLHERSVFKPSQFLRAAQAALKAEKFDTFRYAMGLSRSVGVTSYTVPAEQRILVEIFNASMALESNEFSTLLFPLVKESDLINYMAAKLSENIPQVDPPLIAALKAENIVIAKGLIKSGAQVACGSPGYKQFDERKSILFQIPLHEAIKSGVPELVTLVLENGGNVQQSSGLYQKDRSGFFLPGAGGDSMDSDGRMSDAFIMSFIKSNSRGGGALWNNGNALFVAIEEGNSEIVSLILEAEDLDLTDTLERDFLGEVEQTDALEFAYEVGDGRVTELVREKFIAAGLREAPEEDSSDSESNYSFDDETD